MQGQLLQQREQSLEMKKNPGEMSHPQMNPQGKNLPEKNQVKSLAGEKQEKNLPEENQVESLEERSREKSSVGTSPEETIHRVMSRRPEMLESQSHRMALHRLESERQEPVLGW